MLRALNKYTNILVQVGGGSMLFAALLVTYDVITRKVFNYSIAGADEISGYIFAISTACAFSYALMTRANIRIDLLYNLLPGKLQRWLDLAGILSLAGFYCVIVYFAFDLVADAFTFNSKSVTPLQTPLLIPQSIWFAALCFTTFTALSLLILSLKLLFKGDDDKVKRLIGIPSLEEEIMAELGDKDKAGNSGVMNKRTD